MKLNGFMVGQNDKKRWVKMAWGGKKISWWGKNGPKNELNEIIIRKNGTRMG